jgi:hypothetical protein
MKHTFEAREYHADLIIKVYIIFSESKSSQGTLHYSKLFKGVYSDYVKAKEAKIKMQEEDKDFIFYIEEHILDAPST